MADWELLFFCALNEEVFTTENLHIVIDSIVFRCLAAVESDDISVIGFFIGFAPGRKLESSSLDTLGLGILCLVFYYWHFVRVEFDHLEIPASKHSSIRE